MLACTLVTRRGALLMKMCVRSLGSVPSHACVLQLEGEELGRRVELWSVIRCPDFRVELLLLWKQRRKPATWGCCLWIHTLCGV